MRTASRPLLPWLWQALRMRKVSPLSLLLFHQMEMTGRSFSSNACSTAGRLTNVGAVLAIGLLPNRDMPSVDDATNEEDQISLGDVHMTKGSTYHSSQPTSHQRVACSMMLTRKETDWTLLMRTFDCPHNLPIEVPTREKRRSSLESPTSEDRFTHLHGLLLIHGHAADIVEFRAHGR